MQLKIDVTPLKKYPNYRWLYLGQYISFMGSMITYVAIPFQMYEITKSTFHVGMLGIVQLVPLVISGFFGGALADSFERRRLVINTEIASAIGTLLLVLFTMSGSQSYWVLYALAGLMTIFKGLERPSLEALTQQLIEKKDIPTVSTLQSLKTTSGMILGPAVGGILISSIGIKATYFVDFISYVLSIFCLLKITNIPDFQKEKKPGISSIVNGLQYAWKRPELMGTYIVDMASMTLAFPNPLFPALAMSLGGASNLGWFYSAPAIGAFLGSLTSGWTHKAVRHGKWITIAATVWGLGILAFGWSTNFYLALLFLGIAGWADMISGIFRSTMWNETIPAEYRGRLASVEMISYSSGPLLGNTFMGLLSENIGTSKALMTGGVLAAVASFGIGFFIRSFWKYRAHRS